MDKKPVNLRNILDTAIVFLLIAIFAWHFVLAHPLEDVMPELKSDEIVKCEIWYHERETIPPLTVIHTEYAFEFDTQSEEFREFIELLNSKNYRKQLGNLINTHSRSIKLNPYAQIYLTDKSGLTYEIGLYGQDVVVGTSRNTTDYSPRGGTDFQQSVVDFIFENGSLVNKEVR